jgi:hypothetical protein
MLPGLTGLETATRPVFHHASTVSSIRGRSCLETASPALTGPFDIGRSIPSGAGLETATRSVFHHASTAKIGRPFRPRTGPPGRDRLGEFIERQLSIAFLDLLSQELFETFGRAVGYFRHGNRPVSVGVETLEHHFGIRPLGPHFGARPIRISRFARRRRPSRQHGRQGRQQPRKDFTHSFSP